MKLADMLTPALPDWTKDSRHVDATKVVADAETAVAAANAQIDRAGALIVAIGVDLAQATSDRQASALEDRRDAAINQEAEGRKALERAQRAAKRARDIRAPLEQAAKRDAAKALSAAHDNAVRKVVRDLVALKTSAAALERIHGHAFEQFEGDAPDTLVPAAREFFNDQALAASPVLAKIIGRGGAAIDQFIARVKSFGLI